jgi:hypothetical protein
MLVIYATSKKKRSANPYKLETSVGFVTVIILLFDNVDKKMLIFVPIESQQNVVRRLGNF